MVEHSAVNRVVAGSSPARGAIFFALFYIFSNTAWATDACEDLRMHLLLG